MPANVAIIYDSFGPYHHDRLKEVAARLAAEGSRLIAIQVSAEDSVYEWEKVSASGYEVVTLFDRPLDRTGAGDRLARMLAVIFKQNCRTVFHCGYQRIDALLLALVLRLAGRRVYTLMVSKFDDAPRYIWKELIKYLFLAPYHGAVAAGRRTGEYLLLYGYRKEAIYFGHNTLSLARVAAMASGDASEIDFAERGFVVVARLVEKKNYDFVLDAFKAYRAMPGAPPRALHIFGDGPEMPRIKKRALDEAIPDIVFHGWVGAADIAKGMRRGLCLLLLSKEEQWGNVINESIAVGLPVICAANAGASDHLVRSFVNGFRVGLDGVEETVRAMAAISTDRALYEGRSAGSPALRAMADVPMYGDAIMAAIKGDPSSGARWWSA